MSWYSSPQDDYSLIVAPGFCRKLFSRVPSWEEVVSYYSNSRTDIIAGLIWKEIYCTDIEKAMREKFRYEGASITDTWVYRVDLQDIGIEPHRVSVKALESVYSLAQFDLDKNQLIPLAEAIALKLLDRLAEWAEARRVSKSDVDISVMTKNYISQDARYGSLVYVTLSITYHVPKQIKASF